MKDATSSAIESLYREHGNRLWRAVYAFAGDPEIANDAVSEAFMQLIRRGEGVREPDRWVWRAAFRIAAGDLKERRKRSGARFPETAYEMPESAQDVVRALGRLSPKQRASVVLHHYAGYPVKEIARIIDSTSAAVKVHLSLGRKRLRELLEERDG